MLATSKMTGLDLVGGSSTSSMGVASMKNDSDSKRSSSTSSEEMLSTPKLLPDSHHHHFSKIAAAAHHAASVAHHASATASRSNSENQNNNNESEMLTTPVITTPKTSDIWVSHGGNSSPHLKFEGTSPGSTDPRSCLSDLAPREPPSDLPMDSDIGLRSPCEGIVAKRREKFRRKQQSSLSDSNGSCDTPTSENSPRDLSMAKPPGGGSNTSTSKPSTPTLVKHSPTPPSPLPLTPPSFKHPHRPEALRLKDVAELPAHYTPSPLTVPSPNWMAVKHYLEVSGSQLKTPKELDSSVFDFLTPATPRSRLYRDMEARLSPRHSPRMTIPEVPTDLSSQSRTPTDLSQQRLASVQSGSTVMKMEEESEAAEDLSISSRQAPGTGSPPLQINLQHQQIKQERSPSPLHHGMPPAPELIKIERQIDRPPIGLPPPTALHQLHGNAFDIRMTSGYSGSSTTIPMSHAGQVFRRYIAGESGSSPSNSLTPATAAGGAVTSSNYRDHHNSSPIYHPQSLGPTWHWAQDEEASVSPPQVHFNSSPVKSGGISLKTTDSLMASEFKKAKLETHVSSGVASKKPRANSGKPGKAGKSSAKESPASSSSSASSNASKRVYSCPHCQRSYDWNYNLNRHLKYECGKENAFQCSKCGRKFPHKQNCVYHLKRKHKIVCDTIDQYMTNGLVIFRGSANPGGQHIANPQLNT